MKPIMGQVAIVALLTAAAVRAQETRSMIHGRERDPQGMAVAGAVVTVTRTETNISTRLQSNETESYEAQPTHPRQLPGGRRGCRFQEDRTPRDHAAGERPSGNRSRDRRNHPQKLLLRPFVQMNGLMRSNYPAGRVNTHALEINFERRFSKGLNINASYTRLREREAINYLNEFDAAPVWLEGSYTRPHRFVATSICELPFGKGRKWLRGGAPNMLFGGWQFGATYEFQPGQLLNWVNDFYYGNIDDINRGQRTLDQWFNTANFERTSSRGPAAFHRRVFPAQIPGLRQHRLNWWNANVLREFRVEERVALQLRLDALNLQNRSTFAAPDTNPFSTNFGKVTAQTSATNRLLQSQVRLRYLRAACENPPKKRQVLT